MKAQQILAAMPIPFMIQNKNIYESTNDIGATTKNPNYKTENMWDGKGFCRHYQYPLGYKT